MPEYRDENGKRYRTYFLYVVELDPAACEAPRSCPRRPCNRVPVYVGQSFWTPEERFEQHKRGHHPSRWVERYGLHLRRRLVDPKGEIRGRDAAERAERALGRRLRAKGFCVYGAH
jgi:hypothetical protein